MLRKINFSEIDRKIFDIAVIGGGITGAGVLYEGGKAGYSCILLEKNDFASGTSSRSAKLVHGGLRYLKYGQLGLVREGLKERHYLLQNFPHLVKPLEFLLPVYGSKFLYSIGMSLYKMFSRDKELSSYRFLNKDETINFLPSINPHNLKGSFIYFDAVTNDARLTNEVIHQANEKYNSTALNYCEFLSVTDNNLHFDIHCNDHIEKRLINLRAKYIVNSAGPWVDEILGRLNNENASNTAPSKGVHLVFSSEKLPIRSALLFSSYAGDGRMLYAVPWENNSVIVGATDTDYNGNPDQVLADSSDISYILKALNKFLPSLDLKEKNILSMFAGLRPLLNSGTQSKDRTRDYRCWWSNKRTLNILGGKLTGFHAMASTVIKKISEELTPVQNPLILKKDQKEGVGMRYGYSDNLKNELFSKYGDSAINVLKIVSENENFCQPVTTGISIIHAEIIFFIRYHSVFHLEDLMTRRFSLTYVLKNYSNKKEIISKFAEIMKNELNWTEEKKEKETLSLELLCS